MFFSILIFIFFYVFLFLFTQTLKSAFTLKKLTLISMIFFTTMSFSSYAIETTNKKEDKGFFGAIKEIDEKITSFLDAIKDYKANSIGFFETEISDDEVMIIDNLVVYANDKNKMVSGTVVKRDFQGNIITAMKVKKGLPHGKFREYYPPYYKHILKMEGKHKNGALNGKLKIYFENGELEGIIEYSGGLPDGISKSYYKNGELKSKGEFEKGKKNGKWTYYHQSGKKESEGKYKDDQKVKVWKYYDNNGNLKDETRYTYF